MSCYRRIQRCCTKCNKLYRLIATIPVVFHNLRSYDSHFIMQHIGDVAEKERLQVGVIPNNMERYMSFTLGKQRRFIDSLQFIQSSLSKFVGNLPDDDLKHTCQIQYVKAMMVN